MSQNYLALKFLEITGIHNIQNCMIYFFIWRVYTGSTTAFGRLLLLDDLLFTVRQLPPLGQVNSTTKGAVVDSLFNRVDGRLCQNNYKY